MFPDEGKWAVFLFIIFGVFFVAQTGMAKEFPDHPITLVSPTGPGMQDTMARIVCKAAEKELGVPIVVESKPGAAGTIGVNYVLKSKPDGYTLGSLSPVLILLFPICGKFLTILSPIPSILPPYTNTISDWR